MLAYAFVTFNRDMYYLIDHAFFFFLNEYLISRLFTSDWMYGTRRNKDNNIVVKVSNSWNKTVIENMFRILY